MLTVKQEDGVQVYKSSNSPTTVVLIVREADNRFVLPIQLLGVGLSRDASAEQIRAFVLEESDYFVEAIKKRLERYKRLIGRKFKMHIRDFHRDIEVCINTISDEGISYSFSWDDEYSSHAVSFTRDTHHHVFYVNDDGLSPEGLEMLTSFICGEIGAYERKLLEPLLAIEKYVNERPSLPATITRFVDPNWQFMTMR